MHIEKVILNGFKSYAMRTVVDGFDREFNAITGLNGSGKVRPLLTRAAAVGRGTVGNRERCPRRRRGGKP